MPLSTVLATVTIPVTESMVIPVIESERLKYLAPVPYEAANALDERAIALVVVIFDPALTTIAESMITVNAELPVTPKESVATMVSM